MMEPIFDIVIVGAGPAGLLIGSLLAKSARVLVLEKGTLGKTNKYWVTTVRRLERHLLSECISFRGGRLLVGTFLGSEAIGFGDVAVVDDKKLLQLLIARCQSAHVEFRERSELVSFKWNAGILSVCATSGLYKTRLLIDATGGLSPIARTFRLHRLDGFFSVYGVHLEGIDLLSLDVVVAYVLRLGYPPPMFEVIPTGADSAFCALFLAKRRLASLAELRSGFESHLKNNPFFKMSAHSRLTTGKMGGIPIGSLRKKALPGIVAFGEAALIQPPLLGTAFNEVLEYADFAAEKIALALESEARLSYGFNIKFPLIKRLNNQLQKWLVGKLLKGDTKSLDKMIGAVGQMAPDLVFRLYSNEIGWSDIQHLIYLAQLGASS